MIPKCICRRTALVVNCPPVCWEQMWAHLHPRILIKWCQAEKAAATLKSHLTALSCDLPADLRWCPPDGAAAAPKPATVALKCYLPHQGSALAQAPPAMVTV